MAFKNMFSYTSELSKKQKILVYATIIVVCAVIIFLGIIKIKEANTVYPLPMIGVSHFCTYDEFMEYLPPSSFMKNLTSPETGEYIMSVGCGEKGSREDARKYIFNQKDIVSYTVLWADTSGFGGGSINDKWEYCLTNNKQIAEIFFVPNADKQDITETFQDTEHTKEINGISVKYGKFWFGCTAAFTAGSDLYTVNFYSDDETELIKIVNDLTETKM